VTQKHIVIIGAGFGGLATALRLSHRGHKVTILEKTGEIGGRNKRVQVNDCHFDGGPTLMMMLEPFKRLFTDVGTKLEDHMDIKLCDPSYRVFFADGTDIEGTPNIARMIEQIEAMSGRAEAERYGKLIGDLAELYRISIPNFVRRNYTSMLDLATPQALGMVLKHHMLDNLAKRIEHYVTDPRLRMLFTFQTMYLGLSPYDAPWVYGVLTYMEYGEGIWYPIGGMARIHETVADLAVSKGTSIRLNVSVKSIEGNTVLLENGETISGDLIIANADLPYVEKKLERKPAKKRRYSCSSYMMYMDYKGDLPELLHHNVFFGSDFKGNLDALFHEPLSVPAEPAFYCCINKRTDPDRAPEGHENVFILIPCPNNDYAMSEADEHQMHEYVFDRLRKAAGFDPANIVTMKTYGPREWEGDLNLDKGAAFGLSHDFLQSVCFRPSNKSKDNKSLFYVGASTTPGNGLPMVLISAELVESRLVDAGLV